MSSFVQDTDDPTIVSIPLKGSEDATQSIRHENDEGNTQVQCCRSRERELQYFKRRSQQLENDIRRVEQTNQSLMRDMNTIGWSNHHHRDRVNQLDGALRTCQEELNTERMEHSVSREELNWEKHQHPETSKMFEDDAQRVIFESLETVKGVLEELRTDIKVSDKVLQRVNALDSFLRENVIKTQMLFETAVEDAEVHEDALPLRKRRKIAGMKSRSEETKVGGEGTYE